MADAVVTNADMGNGPEIVARLTADGFAVTALEGSRTAARADAAGAVAEACRRGNVSLLVNNMAAFPTGRVVDTPTATFAAALDGGLNTVFSACREAAAVAVERGAPLTIVNVVSALGIVALAGRAAEGAAGAGVLAAGRALAAEWGPLGIRVAAVVAGPSSGWARRVEDVAGVVPLGRFVAAEDVAGAVAFLAGSDAAAISGAPVVVDGGWLAYGYREDSE